ncbi:MAG: glycosyltransferase family 1 protein [Gammaproteobacteria bacterium]|nr:glycosyltransferase family 1 protein [Gammaproteobacteria bacterium]
MVKVAIIGSQGIPACYGGFEVLAENLVKHLNKQYEFIVYCSAQAYEEQKSSYMGAQLEYIPLKANGVQSIIYDLWSMVKACRQADVLLILGVSGCIFLPLLKLFSSKKFIVNLDGVDWRRAKWNWLARNFLRVSEWVAAKSADQLVADNAAIQDYIYKTYKKDSFLIAYGGDNAIVELPVSDEKKDLTVLFAHKSDSSTESQLIDLPFERYAFTVCRIEPENNIHMILEAFTESDILPIIIVGNWGASEYGQSLKKKYKDNANIKLLDPIWDSIQLFLLRSNAALHIHGHSVGGTNPSLVEAMSIGLPVLAFGVVFNRETTLNEALYFSDKNELLIKIRELDTVALSQLANRMKNIADLRYTWKVISGKYSRLFDRDSGSEKFLGDVIASTEMECAHKADDAKTFKSYDNAL